MNAQTETTIRNPLSLSGVALDWAVGTTSKKKMWVGSYGSDQRQVFVKEGRGSYWYHPTSGGDLNATLESYGLNLSCTDGTWTAFEPDTCAPRRFAVGSSPVEAVLRLVCLLEIGDQVAVPTTLL